MAKCVAKYKHNCISYCKKNSDARQKALAANILYYMHASYCKKNFDRPSASDALYFVL